MIIHTNLARAPLSDAARKAVEAASSYCSLEYDVAAGKRGKRGIRAERLITELTGAEDALIVNNCAAAFFVLTSSPAFIRHWRLTSSSMSSILYISQEISPKFQSYFVTWARFSVLPYSIVQVAKSLHKKDRWPEYGEKLKIVVTKRRRVATGRNEHAAPCQGRQTGSAEKAAMSEFPDELKAAVRGLIGSVQETKEKVV